MGRDRVDLSRTNSMWESSRSASFSVSSSIFLILLATVSSMKAWSPTGDPSMMIPLSLTIFSD